MARGTGRLRAVLFDGQRGRGDAGRLGRSLELRGGRTDAAAPQGLSRPRQPPHLQRLMFDSSHEVRTLFGQLDLSVAMASGDLVSHSPIDGKVIGQLASARRAEVEAAIAPPGRARCRERVCAYE